MRYLCRWIRRLRSLLELRLRLWLLLLPIPMLLLLPAYSKNTHIKQTFSSPWSQLHEVKRQLCSCIILYDSYSCSLSPFQTCTAQTFPSPYALFGRSMVTSNSTTLHSDGLTSPKRFKSASG